MDGGSAASTMPPYYTIMRLPGDGRAEFILVLPMVPTSGRTWLHGWQRAAGDCEPRTRITRKTRTSKWAKYSEASKHWRSARCCRVLKFVISANGVRWSANGVR
jgi:hypothetical protein